MTKEGAGTVECLGGRITGVASSSESNGEGL